MTNKSVEKIINTHCGKKYVTKELADRYWYLIQKAVKIVSPPFVFNVGIVAILTAHLHCRKYLPM